MNITFEKIEPEPYTCTMPGICPGCAGPVMRDDEEKMQDMTGGWWHIYCHHRVLREIADYRKRERPVLTVQDDRPFDPVAVWTWAVIVPVSVAAWFGFWVWMLLC